MAKAVFLGKTGLVIFGGLERPTGVLKAVLFLRKTWALVLITLNILSFYRMFWLGAVLI